MSTLRIRIDDCRPAFRPRAEWVLRTLARDLGRDVQFTDGEADVTYAAAPPASGVWIPLQDDAQAFFEGQDAFPGPSVHRAGDLTLLFPPCAPDRAIAGDIVASAFYLLARWDEYRVADRDRFGRLPFDRSAFTAIEGLDIEDPAVEGYLGALRTALGLPGTAPYAMVLLGPAGSLPEPAQTLPRPRNNHLGYAITWYGLALSLIGVFAAFAWRLRKLPHAARD